MVDQTYFTMALRYARKFLWWDNCINTPMIWKKKKIGKTTSTYSCGVYLILRVFLILVTHPRGEEERPKNPHTKYRTLILRICPTPEGKRQNPGNKLPLHNSLLRGFTWAKIMFFLIVEACPICHLPFLLAVSIAIIISMLLSELLPAVLLFYDFALSLE